MVQVTLCASSLGYLFPQNETQDLRLHSAFKHAVNLYSDAGTFITLLCAQTYLNLPDAARVWLPECWDWRREIAHSDPIQLTPGLLRTPRFCVALDNATLWQSPFVGGMLTLEAFPLVFQHYLTMGSQGLLFCLEHNVQSTLHLPDSLTHQGLAVMEHPDALERQVPQLIGFGKGLTPDGDDYLLGYLAALWLWQLPAPLADHQYRLQQAIDQHAHNTTDISRHYLERALQGHFSEPICQLLAQLVGSASAMTIASCAEQVMQFGATSGVDCLAGMLHGFRTLNTMN